MSPHLWPPRLPKPGNRRVHGRHPRFSGEAGSVLAVTLAGGTCAATHISKPRVIETWRLDWAYERVGKESIMKRGIALLLGVALLAGCGYSRGTRAVTGGLGGAGVGAGVSAVTGGKPATGALIGGGVGAAGGALTGH